MTARDRHARAPLLAAIPAIVFVYLLTLIPEIGEGKTFESSVEWIPLLDVALSFRIDGLSLIFGLLITGVGALVVVYASGYLDRDTPRGQFFTFLLLFMGSMFGLVLADNVIALFVFWELTSITSFALIGFEHRKASARAAARQALLVTGAGGLALLAGLVLLAITTDAWTLSGLNESGVVDSADPLIVAAFLLVAVGALTKSAQMPFHFWLPGAMAAPTPVSAYLHSATMVKAGVYLLARLQPALGEVALWTPLLVTVGGITMVLAALLALRESDLKRVLAYSTISALGTLVFLIGLGEPAALKAAIVFLIAHALYKAALFMVAGAVDHETGTRELSSLGGLRAVMPLTATAAGLAALSKAGLPPALGFLGKETVFAATTKGDAAILLSAAFLVTAILTFALAALTGFRPFIGALKRTPRAPHEAPPSLWMPPLLLAVLGVVVGIAGPWLAGPLIEPALSASAGTEETAKISFWPGVGPVLWLSVAAIGLGALASLEVDRLRSAASRVPLTPASNVYERSLDGLNAVARVQTRALQSPELSRHVAIVILTVVGLTAVPLIARDALVWPEDWTEVRLIEVAVAVLVLSAGIAAAASPSRLRSVLALGAVGYGIALIFVLFGAPDLAMTQVLVETLTVILFVAVFRHLPVTAPSTSRISRSRDALLASAVGVTMMALTWAVLAARGDRHVAEFFLEASRPLAQGRNVVNTILVDFRALDTLGEIVVLAVAATGVIALLRLRPRDEEVSS